MRRCCGSIAEDAGTGKLVATMQASLAMNAYIEQSPKVDLLWKIMFLLPRVLRRRAAPDVVESRSQIDCLHIVSNI